KWGPEAAVYTEISRGVTKGGLTLVDSMADLVGALRLLFGIGGGGAGGGVLGFGKGGLMGPLLGLGMSAYGYSQGGIRGIATGTGTTGMEGLSGWTGPASAGSDLAAIGYGTA